MTTFFAKVDGAIVNLAKAQSVLLTDDFKLVARFNDGEEYVLAAFDSHEEATEAFNDLGETLCEVSYE